MVRKKENEITVAESSELVVAPDYGDDYGDGLQDVGLDEVGLPFVRILQALSPEVARETIDGARPGMFFNTGTQEIFDSITFVPCVRVHRFVEWRPREEGGGRVGDYDPNDEVVKKAVASAEKFGKYKTPEGNDLIETFYVYGVTIDPETEDVTCMVCIPFKSTNITKYKKRFMNRTKYCYVKDATGKPRNPPLYAHRIVMGTVKESNDQHTWHNFEISFAVEDNPAKSIMKPEHPAYQAAKSLKELVVGGQLQADFGNEGGNDGGESKEDGQDLF